MLPVGALLADMSSQAQDTIAKGKHSAFPCAESFTQSSGCQLQQAPRPRRTGWPDGWQYVALLDVFDTVAGLTNDFYAKADEAVARPALSFS
jgi:hypothetical protein